MLRLCPWWQELTAPLSYVVVLEADRAGSSCTGLSLRDPLPPARPYPPPESSTTFQNNATIWAPTVQIQEPVGELFTSKPNSTYRWRNRTSYHLCSVFDVYSGVLGYDYVGKGE